MASQGREHDALWAKLWELELQLAAYKLLHAARCGEGEEDDDAGVHGARETGSCCRGRQYDAYMRRRDARRASVAGAAADVQVQQPRPTGATRAGSVRPTPLTIKCAAARDTPQVRRPLPVATTPRKELPLARSRTVTGGGAPAAKSHQRRNSVGGDLGRDCATPRPFLRRGSGTGGATGVVHLLRSSPRVHDLPPSSSPSPRRPPPPPDHLATKTGRHLRSVSEVPLHAAAMESPRWAETPPRARKRCGSVESPRPALFSGAAAASNPHMDLAKGLRKLLSFVRKSSKSGGRQNGGGDGKPVKGWAPEAAAPCASLDGPLELSRAGLQGHRFPMTRAVGTSG